MPKYECTCPTFNKFTYWKTEEARDRYNSDDLEKRTSIQFENLKTEKPRNTPSTYLNLADLMSKNSTICFVHMARPKGQYEMWRKVHSKIMSKVQRRILKVRKERFQPFSALPKILKKSKCLSQDREMLSERRVQSPNPKVMTVRNQEQPNTMNRLKLVLSLNLPKFNNRFLDEQNPNMVKIFKMGSNNVKRQRVMSL